MFTVKHVTPIGNEALYAASEVTFSHDNNTIGYAPGVVWLRVNDSDPLLELRSGTAYVMNNHGSTVATYRLVEDFKQYQGYDDLQGAGQKASINLDVAAAHMTADQRIR